MPDDGLQSLLNPESIAVIGASDDPEKIGGRLIAYLRAYGYRGRIYPINTKRATVQGLPAYASMHAIERRVDLAVIVTPASAVLDSLEACGRSGARTCAILSSGFGEVGEAGKQDEVRIGGIARRYGMRVLGPNCQGVANLASGGVASFSTCFADHHVQPGGLAIVSQSGAVAGMLCELQSAHPTGVRYWAATGNEADVTVAELVHRTVQHPDVRVVEAYCEHVGDVPGLAAAAAEALAAGKAIVMLKAGVTAEGTKAASSHTGALAQDEAVVDAFLRQHGIVRAQHLHEVTALARVFSTDKQPSGSRVAILTNSGGLGVMMADRCRRAGLELAELSATTTEALKQALPAYAAVGNPVDVTAQLLSDSRLLSSVLPALAADPGVDIVVVGLGMVGHGYDVRKIISDVVRIHQSSDRLLALCWVGGEPSAVDDLSRHGVPAFVDDAACIDAIARYVDHCRRVRTVEPPPVSGPELVGDSVPPETFRPGPDGFLSESAGKSLMRHWGLPVVRGELVGSPEDAVSAARRLGYPVVLKLSSSALPHKTELGAVRLGLRDDDAVHRAGQDLMRRGQEAGLESVDGLLVEETAHGLEMALGAKWDPTFGAVVLVGAGGVHVETRPDFDLLFPPFTRKAIERAVGSLAIAPVLRNLRGVGELDRDGLFDLVEAFGRRIASADYLAEVDLNPVFVRPTGQGVVIADAAVRIAASEDRPRPPGPAKTRHRSPH